MSTKFDEASLAYFRATGHDLPKHVTDRTIAEFLLSESRRFSGQPGTAARLLCALREYERT